MSTESMMSSSRVKSWLKAWSSLESETQTCRTKPLHAEPEMKHAPGTTEPLEFGSIRHQHVPASLCAIHVLRVEWPGRRGHCCDGQDDKERQKPRHSGHGATRHGCSSGDSIFHNVVGCRSR